MPVQCNKITSDLVSVPVRRKRVMKPILSREDLPRETSVHGIREEVGSLDLVHAIKKYKSGNKNRECNRVETSPEEHVDVGTGFRGTEVMDTFTEPVASVQGIPPEDGQSKNALKRTLVETTPEKRVEVTQSVESLIGNKTSDVYVKTLYVKDFCTIIGSITKTPGYRVDPL